MLVTVVEFSLKAGLVYYNYIVDGQNEATVVAEDLANNVRSTMQNEGGPVAARTMYPILERNWSDLGYTIAIEPAQVSIGDRSAVLKDSMLEMCRLEGIIETCGSLVHGLQPETERTGDR